MLSDNFTSNTLRPLFSQALSLKLETIKLDAFIRNFSQGQTLPGKVIQVLPEQKAVVEFKGEKLLLQFPRPVHPGQNISIQIEQIHPKLVLKLADSTFTALPKALDNHSRNEPPLAGQKPDKISFQSRETDLLPKTAASNKGTSAVVKGVETVLNGKVTVLYSKTDLNQLGVRTGNQETAEVIRVVDPTTLQIRLNGNETTIKHAAGQKFQPGEAITVVVKPDLSGKFELALEPKKISSNNLRPPLGLSILKNYLPSRQPLGQVLTFLKETFLEGTLSPLKELNVDLAPLRQLQANLQTITSKKTGTPDALQLKEMVDRSGVHYEARVRDFVLEPTAASKKILFENDLKGQLIRIARQLEPFSMGSAESSTSEKFVTKLVSQVNQAVSNIELQQLVHHFSREEHQPLMLQLPENLIGEENRFRVYILHDQKEGAESEGDPTGRPLNLVFLLNLSALEDLRIETKVMKDQISIHITGSNSGAVQFIQAHASELEELFLQEGFSVDVTSDYSTDFSMAVPDSLGQLLVDTPLQMIDIAT